MILYSVATVAGEQTQRLKLIRPSCDFSCDSKSNSQKKDSAITAPLDLCQLALEAKLVISEIIFAWFAFGSVVTYTR